MSINRFDIWNTEKVIAGYTTDSGGSFRYHQADDVPNYELLGHAFSLETDRMIRVYQMHTDHILPVNEKNGGNGILCEGIHDGFDAMVTDTPDLMLCVITADCVPVFLFDEVNGAIGMVHSGRAGTWKEIALKAVQQMHRLYNSRPEDIQCILGPHLCANHHEVNKEDIFPFSERFTIEEQKRCIEISGEKAYVDMGTAVQISLIRSGIRKENIFNCNRCTYEDQELFSWRRTKNPYAHILSFIALKG